MQDRSSQLRVVGGRVPLSLGWGGQRHDFIGEPEGGLCCCLSGSRRCPGTTCVQGQTRTSNFLGWRGLLQKKHLDVYERRVVCGLAGVSFCELKSAGSGWVCSEPDPGLLSSPMQGGAGRWTARPRVQRLWLRPHPGHRRQETKTFAHELSCCSRPLICPFHSQRAMTVVASNGVGGCGAVQGVGLPTRVMGKWEADAVEQGPSGAEVGSVAASTRLPWDPLDGGAVGCCHPPHAPPALQRPWPPALASLCGESIPSCRGLGAESSAPVCSLPPGTGPFPPVI